MIIERHFLKLNLYSKGYCLFINENNFFEENDINVTNEKVPQAFISIQKNIESILLSYKLPVSISFKYDALRKKLLIGFGIFLNIPDDKDREGIVYIHCVELSDTDHLYSIVLQIVKILSIKNINNFYQKILRKIANENTEILSLLKLLCNQIDEYRYISQNSLKNSSTYNIYSKIYHDCAGGASIAWLTFGFQLSNNNTNWEVFDFIEKDETVSTSLKSIYNDNIISTSELLIISQESKIFSSFNIPKIENNEEDNINPDVEEFVSNDELSELKKNRISNNLTNEYSINHIDKKDKSKKTKKKLINRLQYLKQILPLAILISFIIYMYFDELRIQKINYDLASLKTKVYNDSITIENLDLKIENLNAKMRINFKKEIQLTDNSNNSSESRDPQEFINYILSSIDGKGDKLTESELNKALSVNSDSIFLQKIDFLINNFGGIDIDGNLKLDNKEIEKAFNKEDIF